MLFTKIWTAVLAVLATVCLAGMYLLSTGSSGGFTEADNTAVRAVTEAGMAALASDVNGSPVSLGPSLLTDSRLKDALDPPAEPPVPKPDEDGFEPQSLEETFEQVANESLLSEYPLMSVALVDKSGTVVAKTGLAPELFDELDDLDAMKEALKKDDAQLISATLGGKLHAIKLSRPVAETQARRLVAIQVVELGGGSFFRRVVGTGNPAGLVRGKMGDKEVIGDVIGGAKSEELIAWVEAHIDEIPPEGASAVFEVGEGGEKRIGAAARVPGPAGKGKEGTVFVVLSAHNLASTQQDMATALSAALNDGGLGKLNWPLVAGLLVISLVLTFYLPHIEFNAPMKRLQDELGALIEGRKHQLDHDTYGGMFGTLGRSISAVLEAQRVSLDAALVDGDADSSARRTRSTRAVRAASTRSNPRRPKSREHKALDGDDNSGDDEAIELPSAGGADVERHAAADLPPPPIPRSSAATPLISAAPAFDEAAAPDTSDEDDGDAISLAAATGGDRESYYQRIYTEFVETKTACGESIEGFTYEKFAKKLRKQSDDLLGRADVKDVEFSVYVKDGKAALRAKVIKA
ncbi:MXAN_5187 family protein [Nannocystaceae bacterium ST9]